MITSNAFIMDSTTDVKRYYAKYLPYMATQPPVRDDLIASVLERNTVEFSAQQEWETEWNQAGLASRLSEQVCICACLSNAGNVCLLVRNIGQGKGRGFRSVLPSSCDKVCKLHSKVASLMSQEILNSF